MRLSRFVGMAFVGGAARWRHRGEGAVAVCGNQILPPELAVVGGQVSSWWQADDDPWITPGEQSGFETTPDYDTSVEWLQRLVPAAPELEMTPFGKSLEGRTLWMVIASADGASTPETLHAAGRPVVLAQAAIHSGEIDGKDAGLMLLRDLSRLAGPCGLLLRSSELPVRTDPQSGRARAQLPLRPHEPARAA